MKQTCSTCIHFKPLTPSDGFVVGVAAALGMGACACEKPSEKRPAHGILSPDDSCEHHEQNDARS
jgi:hypothetical protein